MGEPRRTEAPARDRILDAAERAFAADGFAGTGMKAIAQEAGVAQGLLHYHFDGKEGLYAAVIERRSGIINALRHQMLDRVDLRAPDAVTRIMEALLVPPLRPEGGGQAYGRILGGLAAGDARDAALVREYYDATALRFIGALQTALPDAAPRAISWGYNLAIGALVVAVARSGRPERLIGGSDAAPDMRDVTRRLVAYATGGLFAVIASERDEKTP